MSDEPDFMRLPGAQKLLHLLPWTVPPEARSAFLAGLETNDPKPEQAAIMARYGLNAEQVRYIARKAFGLEDEP